jgi:hypothetical protein
MQSSDVHAHYLVGLDHADWATQSAMAHAYYLTGLDQTDCANTMCFCARALPHSF